MQKKEYILAAISLVLIVFIQRLDHSQIQQVFDWWHNIQHERLIKDVTQLTFDDGDKIYRDESNLNNGGLILETDEYDYVVFDHLHLEMVDQEMKTVEVLVSNAQGTGIQNLQMVGDWLYYSKDGVNRINIRTHERETIYKGSVSEMYVNRDSVFLVDYKRGLRLFKMGINGENLQCINNDRVLDIFIGDQMIYAVTETKGFKLLSIMDLNGKDVEKITPFSGSNMVLEGRNLYYRAAETGFLEVMDIKTQKKTVIVDDYVYYFNMKDGKIVYSLKDLDSEYGDAKGIYLMDDGNIITLDDETLMSTGQVSFINDLVFYESDYKAEPFGNMVVRLDGSGAERLERNPY